MIENNPETRKLNVTNVDVMKNQLKEYLYSVNGSDLQFW